MKKAEKRELLRIQNVIENDRLNVGKGFNELLISDLEKLLKDYFDYSDDLDLKIIKQGCEYKVNISLAVSRIRAFNCLLKDS